MTISQRLYSSKIQGKRRAYEKNKVRRRNKKIKVGDDDDNPDFKLVSEFLKQANEDILFEIFLRLPNCRSAILLGSVCRGWQSLISHPEFIPSFICHHREHQDRFSLPYSIIFRKADVPPFKGVQHYQPICKVFSEGSMLLHGNAAESTTTSYLDFMPCPVVIRASFDDLLLVSDGSRCAMDYYICNPVTKQFYQLPKLPEDHCRPPTIVGWSLVCSRKSKQVGFAKYQYKVVIIHNLHDMGPNVKQLVATFCSESGCWSWSPFVIWYPLPKQLWHDDLREVVTCNGVLYWLDSEWTVETIVAFDLFNSRSHVIGFPHDLGCGYENTRRKAQLGVVGTELRLLVFFVADTGPVIKVWKLNYKDSSWVLVNEKSNLKRANNDRLVGLFVHPTNGDAVFMVWGKHVFQYKFIEDAYEMIAELDESVRPLTEFALPLGRDRLFSIPLLHPTWPTPVPPT